MIQTRLAGTVALVAGATRGAGRGIARELGAAGATVYVTGIAVRCDHTDPAQVAALVGRVRVEQSGRLDLLVNDIWGGDALAVWGKPF